MSSCSEGSGTFCPAPSSPQRISSRHWNPWAWVSVPILTMVRVPGKTVSPQGTGPQLAAPWQVMGAGGGARSRTPAQGRSSLNRSARQRWLGEMAYPKTHAAAVRMGIRENLPLPHLHKFVTSPSTGVKLPHCRNFKKQRALLIAHHQHHWDVFLSFLSSFLWMEIVLRVVLQLLFPTSERFSMWLNIVNSDW